MAKQFFFKGKTIEELQKLSLDEFVAMLPARHRRSYKRGWTKDQKCLLKSLQANSKNLKTHSRDMLIIPEMVGKKLAVYNGKEFVYVEVAPEMLGHYLGEFALTRKSVKHSAAGIGATRSTKFVSVK